MIPEGHENAVAWQPCDPIDGPRRRRPVALRPTLSRGLPFSGNESYGTRDLLAFLVFATTKESKTWAVRRGWYFKDLEKLRVTKICRLDFVVTPIGKRATTG